MFAKIAKYSALALAAAGLLTGCTPPPPPEVLAAWAEQSPTCIKGEASVFLPVEAADAADGLVGAVGMSCDGSDPKKLAAMNAVLADTPDNANIVVATDGNFGSQQSYTEVPWAVDGAVLVANLPSNSGLNLTPELAAGILSGKVTDWSDPLVAKANPNETYDSMPIVVSPNSTQKVIDAFSGWMNYLTGKELPAPKLTAKTSVSLDELNNLPTGGVALVPLSLKSEFDLNALSPMITASVIVGKDPNDPTLDLAVAPDSVGVASAATQLVTKKSGSNLVATIDHSILPTPPAGADKPDAAYGAIFTVDMHLVGKDSKVTRAVARYLLRQDEQGLMGNSYLLPLWESTRIESLAMVSQGLPEPILPEDATR